jgi:hypothetical protein
MADLCPPDAGLDVDAPDAEPEFAGSFAAEPAVLERVGSPERSFPCSFAWLAVRFGRFDLFDGLYVGPSELVPPAFPRAYPPAGQQGIVVPPAYVSRHREKYAAV